MRRISPCYVELLRATVLLCFIFQATARASLQVYPTRIILSDQKRVASVSLRHLGEKPGEYRISAVFYRMKANGSNEMVKDPTPEERSATQYLRFSPRSATIPPRREQVVQVMYIGPKNLPEGEYRAHLHFEPMFDDEPISLTAKSGSGISMAVKARVAIAIPVIYRRGKPQYSVSLSDLKLVKTASGYEYTLQMDRKGNAYPFGDFEAFFTPAGGSAQSVGLARGIACYLDKRSVGYPLTIPPNLKIANGSFSVEFREPEVAGVKGKVIDTLDAVVP